MEGEGLAQLEGGARGSRVVGGVFCLGFRSGMKRRIPFDTNGTGSKFDLAFLHSIS